MIPIGDGLLKPFGDDECDISNVKYQINVPSGKKQLDPENHHFLEETNLPTPMTTTVYVNLLEGKS